MPYPTGYRLTASATPQQIKSPNTDQQGAVYLIIKNLDSTNSVDLGDENVVANQGYQLKPAETITFWANPGQYVWMVAEAGSPIIHVLENLR